MTYCAGTLSSSTLNSPMDYRWQLVQLEQRLCFAPLSFVLATPAMACSADLLGLSEGRDVGMSDLCNGMITIVRAVGVHPKIVDPLIAAAFACLLLLMLGAASSMMSSCGLHCVHVFARLSTIFGCTPIARMIVITPLRLSVSGLSDIPTPRPSDFPCCSMLQDVGDGMPGVRDTKAASDNQLGN